MWVFCKLRRNCARCPCCPWPEFACTSFPPPLCSPEEDLPWQGPEEKEGEGCRNSSCHSAGTLEPFLSLVAKERGDILWECRKYRAFLPLGQFTRSLRSQARSCSFSLYPLLSFPLPCCYQSGARTLLPQMILTQIILPAQLVLCALASLDSWRASAWWQELGEIIFGHQPVSKPWRILEGREEGEREKDVSFPPTSPQMHTPKAGI